MVQSLEIIKDIHSPKGEIYRLQLRQYNGVEVERVSLFRMTAAQAVALERYDRDITYRTAGPTGPEFDAIAPAPLEIRRATNRVPNGRAWEGFIGGDTVNFLSDGAVRVIQENGNPVFEPGQPDWKLREIEELEDKVADHRDTIGKIEAMIGRKRMARFLDIARGPVSEQPELHDRVKDAPVDPAGLPEGVSPHLISLYAQAHDLTFYTLGSPPAVSEKGWADPDLVRFVSNGDHAAGVTRPFSDLLDWVRGPAAEEAVDAPQP